MTLRSDATRYLLDDDDDHSDGVSRTSYEDKKWLAGPPSPVHDESRLGEDKHGKGSHAAGPGQSSSGMLRESSHACSRPNSGRATAATGLEDKAIKAGRLDPRRESVSLDKYFLRQIAQGEGFMDALDEGEDLLGLRNDFGSLGSAFRRSLPKSQPDFLMAKHKTGSSELKGFPRVENRNPTQLEEKASSRASRRQTTESEHHGRSEAPVDGLAEPLSRKVSSDRTDPTRQGHSLLAAANESAYPAPSAMGRANPAQGLVSLQSIEEESVALDSSVEDGQPTEPSMDLGLTTHLPSCAREGPPSVQQEAAVTDTQQHSAAVPCSHVPTFEPMSYANAEGSSGLPLPSPIAARSVATMQADVALQPPSAERTYHTSSSPAMAVESNAHAGLHTSQEQGRVLEFTSGDQPTEKDISTAMAGVSLDPLKDLTPAASPLVSKSNASGNKAQPSGHQGGETALPETPSAAPVSAESGAVSGLQAEAEDKLFTPVESAPESHSKAAQTSSKDSLPTAAGSVEAVKVAGAELIRLGKAADASCEAPLASPRRGARAETDPPQDVHNSPQVSSMASLQNTFPEASTPSTIIAPEEVEDRTALVADEEESSDEESYAVKPKLPPPVPFSSRLLADYAAICTPVQKLPVQRKGAQGGISNQEASGDASTASMQASGSAQTGGGFEDRHDAAFDSRSRLRQKRLEVPEKSPDRNSLIENTNSQRLKSTIHPISQDLLPEVASQGATQPRPYSASHEMLGESSLAPIPAKLPAPSEAPGSEEAESEEKGIAAYIPPHLEKAQAAEATSSDRSLLSNEATADRPAAISSTDDLVKKEGFQPLNLLSSKNAGCPMALQEAKKTRLQATSQAEGGAVRPQDPISQPLAADTQPPTVAAQCVPEDSAGLEEDCPAEANAEATQAMGTESSGPPADSISALGTDVEAAAIPSWVQGREGDVRASTFEAMSDWGEPMTHERDAAVDTLLEGLEIDGGRAAPELLDCPSDASPAVRQSAQQAGVRLSGTAKEELKTSAAAGCRTNEIQAVRCSATLASQPAADFELGALQCREELPSELLHDDADPLPINPPTTRAEPKGLSRFAAEARVPRLCLSPTPPPLSFPHVTEPGRVPVSGPLQLAAGVLDVPSSLAVDRPADAENESGRRDQAVKAAPVYEAAPTAGHPVDVSSSAESLPTSAHHGHRDVASDSEIDSDCFSARNNPPVVDEPQQSRLLGHGSAFEVDDSVNLGSSFPRTPRDRTRASEILEPAFLGEESTDGLTAQLSKLRVPSKAAEPRFCHPLLQTGTAWDAYNLPGPSGGGEDVKDFRSRLRIPGDPVLPPPAADRKHGVDTQARPPSNIPQPSAKARPPKASLIGLSGIPRLPNTRPQGGSKPSNNTSHQAGLANYGSGETSNPPRMQVVTQEKKRMKAGVERHPSSKADGSPPGRMATKQNSPHHSRPSSATGKDAVTPLYERRLRAAMENEAMAFQGKGTGVINSPADALKGPKPATRLTAYDKHLREWDGEPLA